MDHMSHMHQTAAAYPVLFPPVPPPLGMPSPAFMGAPSPSPVGFSYWPYLMANHLLPHGYGPPSATAALWTDYSGVASTPCEALGATVVPVPSGASGVRPSPVTGGPHLLGSLGGAHMELSFRRHHNASPAAERRLARDTKEPLPGLDEPLTMEELYLDRRGGRDPESYSRLLEQFALSEIVMRCEELEVSPAPLDGPRRFRCTLCPPEKAVRYSDLFALKLHREKAHEDFLSYELIDGLAETLLAEAATPPQPPPSGAKKAPLPPQPPPPQGEEAMETEEAPLASDVTEAPEAKEEAVGVYFPPPPPPLMGGANPNTSAIRRQAPPPPQLMLSGNLALSQCGPSGLGVPLGHLHGPDCNRGRCNGFTAANDSRRGRTRLSEQQRRILRASFSLSQSPSEEDIGDLAQRTQLPGRVVKHWFRNTLFKERQRCRDSPYNFNAAPKSGGEEETGVAARPEGAAGGAGEEEKLTNGPGESSSASRSQSVSSVDSCMDSIEMDSIPDGDLCWQQSSAMSGPMAAAAACDGGQLPANYPYFYRQYLTYILSHIQQQQQQQQQQQEQHRHHHHHHHEQHRQQLQESLQLQQLLHFHSAPSQPPPVSLAPPPPPPPPTCGANAAGSGLDGVQCSMSAASSAASLPSNATSLSSSGEDGANTAASIGGAGGVNLPTTNGTSASPSPQPPSGTASEDPAGCVKAHSGPLFVPAVSAPTVAVVAPSDGTTAATNGENAPPPPGTTPQGLQQYHRRVRTTINNNQLSYLLSCYEKDSNPSKRQQEAIASRTGLPRRVVQVWFQNTRARDRKGTLRGIGASAATNCAGGAQQPPPPPPPMPQAPSMVVTGGGPAAKIRRQETPSAAAAVAGAKQCPRCTATFRSTTAFELHTIRCRPAATQAPPLQLSPPTTIVKSPTVTTTKPLAPPRAHERTEEQPQTPPAAPPPPPPPLLTSRQLVTPAAPPLPVMTSLRPPRLPLAGAFGPPPVDLTREVAVTEVAAVVAPSGPAVGGAESGLDFSNDQPLDLSTWQKPRAASPPPPCLVLAPHPSSVPPSPVALSGVDSEGGGTSASSAGANVRPSTFATAAQSPAGASKRSRTNITPFQLRMMREIFPLHKMPTVAECETLGKRIGLSRRVVQVWFQNQRAKEKKNAREGQAPGSGGSSSSNDSPILDSPQGSNAGQSTPQPPQRVSASCLSRELCSLCNTRFDGTAGAGADESSLGAHLFSAEHLSKLGAFLEKCGIQQHRDSAPGKCLLSLQRPPDPAYVSLGSGGGGGGGSCLGSPPPWLPHSSPDK